MKTHGILFIFKQTINLHVQIYIYDFVFFFHSCTAHLDAIKVFYIPTDVQ